MQFLLGVLYRTLRPSPLFARYHHLVQSNGLLVKGNPDKHPPHQVSGHSPFSSSPFSGPTDAKPHGDQQNPLCTTVGPFEDLTNMAKRRTQINYVGNHLNENLAFFGNISGINHHATKPVGNPGPSLRSTRNVFQRILDFLRTVAVHATFRARPSHQTTMLWVGV